MKTVTDLFDQLGGPAAVARIIGKRQSTASEMKRRSSIPPEYWPAIIQSESGQRLGVTADHLMRLHVQAEVAA